MPKLYFYLAGALLALNLLMTCHEPSKAPEDESPQDTIRGPVNYQLVWHDEFNDSTIDLNKWIFEVNAHGGGNNELQYYTDRPLNCYLRNGVLVIQALQEQYTGPDGPRDYTSARINTRLKGDWKYGWFEIRAKLPYGKGLWPAIWMMPTDSRYGSWPASGEIDIMELLGHEPNKVYGTIHYGGTYPIHLQSGKSYQLAGGSFAADFHTFALQWDSTSIKWYVDGILYQTQTSWSTQGYPYPAPFDQPFFLILNVAVGGNWPGNPDNTTSFPQRMEVDYVRIFQRIKS
nr:laminarinase [Candidatus Neomarinimicrobiota bacterium]